MGSQHTSSPVLINIHAPLPLLPGLLQSRLDHDFEAGVTNAGFDVLSTAVEQVISTTASSDYKEALTQYTADLHPA